MASYTITKSPNPGDSIRTVRPGKMALGSQKLNAVLNQGAALAAQAARQSTPAQNIRVSHGHGGANMGDKTVGTAGLLGRAAPMYKPKSETIVKKKK